MVEDKRIDDVKLLARFVYIELSKYLYYDVTMDERYFLY